MKFAASPCSLMRGCMAALVLSWALLPSVSAQTQRPNISDAHKEQLSRLATENNMLGLKALMQTLESKYNTDSLPSYGVYKARLLFSEDKSQQGMIELHKSLSLVKQQWERSPTAKNGSDYAFVLDEQAELLQKQAQQVDAVASLDLAYDVAEKALGKRHPKTQWLLYKRMYLALSNTRYPLASELFRQLEQTLPKPLNKCRADICRSLRFQQANLAGSMGNPTLAMRLSKELMPDLANDPVHAAWNVYQLVNLSVRLKQPQELQRWCKQAGHMATQPRFANLEGMNRVIAHCTRTNNVDASKFDALIEQETQSRGIDGEGRAYLLLQKAEYLSKNKYLQNAVHAAAQAWAIGVARDEDYWQWQAQRTIAEAMIDIPQRMSESIYHAKLSINAQQRMLNDKGLDPNQRDDILRSGLQIYEQLSEWLLEEQRFTEAEQTLMLAREQSYHQQVRNYRPSLRTLDLIPAEQERSAALQPLESALHQAWLKREHNSKALEEVLIQASQSLDATMTTPEAAAAHVSSLKALGSEQTEVRFLPAPESIHVLIRNGAQAEQRVRLPISQKQLTQDIAQLRRQLQERGSNPQPLAHKLYRQLWQPLQQWLPAPQPNAEAGKAPEVRVHLEGALRYLPMAVLHDGQHWLGESYALPQDTGVQPQVTQEAAPNREGWSLLGSSHAAADLPALPKVKEEIESLARLADDQGIAHDQQQDDLFTADSLRHALQTRKVVHLASHFRLMPGNGQASGLYLGNGQLLTLGELSDPSFRFDGLDLLTLSACETAVPSGPAEQGLPVDSLAWLAQARGARHVLASLWAVADEGTQQFMTAFYTALSSPMDHPQAVRAAQLAMLKSTQETQATKPQLRGLSDKNAAIASGIRALGLAHPYYWSAFVLLDSAAQ